MPSKDSDIFESSFSRTQSILRNYSPARRSVTNRTVSQHLSPKASASTLRFADRAPQSAGGAGKLSTPTSPRSTIKSPVRRGISFHKRKSSKNPGTILRAVPASAACAAAPLLTRDMAVPNQEIYTTIGCISPTSNGHSELSPTRSHTQNKLVATRLRSSSATALSPIKAGTEMKTFSSAPSLKGVIGTYKHGRVEWDQRDCRSDSRSMKSSFSKLSISGKSQKPQIQLVIPEGQRNEKPLPTSPFFNKASHSHGRSTSGEIEIMYNVSPPSGSKEYTIRNSIVSPLSSQQTRPAPHFYASINTQTFKTEMGSPELSHTAGNSSDDSREDDVSSTYSDQSSMTSAEASGSPIPPKPSNMHKRNFSKEYSVNSPVGAGVFDSSPRKTAKSDETGHRVTPPSPGPRRYAHHPPIEDDIMFKPSCIRPLRSASNTLCRQPSAIRKPSVHSIRRRSVSTKHEMGAINQVVNRSAPKQFSPRIPSPTLSEAENDLEQHLTSFSDDNPFNWDEIFTKQNVPLSPQGLPRKDSVTYDVPECSPPPRVPRRSSKRQTFIDSDGTFRMSRVPEDHIASQWKRKSLNKGKGLTITIPETKRMTADSMFVLSPIPIPPKDVKRSITPEVAEDVIYNILRSLESLDDLFAMAIVNKGFYRVFKRHEIELMKIALRRMSPPAWEHREICYPGYDELHDEDLDRPRQEYTPTSYIRYYTRDMYIIAALKSLIKDKCQSFLRPEISVAIISEDAEESSRVDDALWRIWTFCKIFGSGKGREEDLMAQMDWLKGGELVHQQTCTFSAMMCDDMNETLASAPECFAKGNEGGLTAEQLFDMMELWNCLAVLLQPIEGRTIQAREYGVFDNTDVRGGDIDGEELMLDEWYYYILTLGLSTILDLTGPCYQDEAAVFMVASQNDWINWKPPVHGGTRRHFLKEAASRVYEEKITLTYAESSTKEVQRQISKQRIQRHISELRHRKNNGERLDVIRMSQERPMSEWEGVMHNLTRPRPRPVSNNLVTHIPSLRPIGANSALVDELSVRVSELPAARTPPPPRSQSPPRRIIAQPLLPTPPPSTVPSTRDRSSLATSIGMPLIDEHPAFRKQDVSIPEMPRLEEHPMFRQHLRQMSGASHEAPSAAGSNPSVESHPAFQQHPLQHFMQSHDNSAENTADRAIYRIVEMGFTPEQARQALRRTDVGDGLRVDRAVELLLREAGL